MNSVPGQWPMRRGTVYSWGQAAFPLPCQRSRSRKRGKWWCPGRTHQIHGTVQWCHRIWRPCWGSFQVQWTHVVQPFQCLRQVGYGRSQGDTQSRGRLHRQHHPRQDYQRSSARIGCVCLHHQGKPIKKRDMEKFQLIKITNYIPQTGDFR